MKLKIVLFVIVALLTLEGCASTTITSFKDPQYKTTTFNRILVIANFSNLQRRWRVETQLVKEFQRIGVFAIEYLNLFPPTRDYTDEEKINQLVNNNIDSFIMIDAGESGVSQVYIPQIGSYTTKTGKVNIYGNAATYDEKSTTTNYGGYVISKPWAHFNAKLFNASNGQNAWIASAFTGGNGLAGFDTVIDSFCWKMVQQLIDDGIIIKTKWNDW